MGSRPTFRLEIENRTPQTVSFSYWVPLFCYPLFDSGIPPIQAQVYNGPAQPVTVSLRPGEKHELSSSPFRLVVHAQAGPEAQWPATAGLYSAQFQVDLRGAKGQPWRLRSNRVNLRVTP